MKAERLGHGQHREVGMPDGRPSEYLLLVLVMVVESKRSAIALYWQIVELYARQQMNYSPLGNLLVERVSEPIHE